MSSVEQLLKDAEVWLSCIPNRQDPQTKLIRALTEALTKSQADLKSEQEAHLMTAIHSGN